MKKVLFLSMALLSVMLDTSAFGAAPVRRGRTTSGTSTVAAAPKTTAARAAVNSRSGGTKTTTVSAPKVTSARAAVKNTTAAPKAPTVAARAGTTQKVIGTGTKVASAAKNIVVNEECQAKYEGCMDAFCMIDNDNGGRCVCSNRSLELDAVLAEIEKLDEQSYQMATLGVEKLEMGADADAAIAAANSVAQSLREGGEPNKKARRALDLSAWDVSEEDEEDSIFGASFVDPNSIEGKEGDALHSVAMNLCKAQIPECAKDINMLQLMYSQKIKSDCTAYENSLKQKKSQSAQKLQAAERALRETALEQYQNANKYDLGQCTIKFKECMQTTAGCGDDFSKCASVSAMDSTNTRQSTSKKSKNYQIKGAVSNIEVSASTYDALMAKKPICDTVTKQCTRVAGQVWDTFLREVAPQLKSAELIAEDNARQDCIGNISSCFQKACKDNMDPNNPDGSYDMCLSRPEAMLNVCKIPLNACGVDASSASKAKESIVWDFVAARLAAMRVDACTNEVKACLQAEDVCGKDYLNCIGLDTYTVVSMCHRDKLTACYSSEYGDDDKVREDYIYSVAQGLILNIDNEMLAQCQKAANEAMIKVCGDTESCESMTIPEGVGAHSLEYKVCEASGDDMLVYSNCKQDVSLIPDAELLGMASSAETIAKLTKEYEDSQKQLEGKSDLTKKLISGVNKAVYEEKLFKARLENTYSGPKNFTGMIDGVISWDKIITSIDLPSQCQEDGINLGGDDKNKQEVKQLCISGMSKAVESSALGQNNATKIEQALSDLGALRNSIQNTIFAIESDPKVQFCMTGRKVQGLNMGKDGKAERIDARFPNLTDSMKVVIAQSALQKARANYDKKYKELDKKLRDENAKLAQRIVDVREAQEAKDRIPILAKTCLGTAVSIANNSTVGEQDYVRSTADEDDPYYRETVTTTFSPTTLICKKCVRKQNCNKKKGYKNAVDDTRYCKDWADPVEECSETQY